MTQAQIDQPTTWTSFVQEVRLALAVDVAKILTKGLRSLGRGGAALPGLVATKIDPAVVPELSRQIDRIAMITGTNGKTTTSRILGKILADAGASALRNKTGSNLERGIAASLIESSNLRGRLDGALGDLAIFEVDEAAVPGVVRQVHPQLLVLLDLFRDQLDRYGEVATVARLWSEALDDLPPTSCVVANADDPLVANVASTAPRSLYFGLASADREPEGREHASDVKACPRCNHSVGYTSRFLGHLGHYSCSSCGYARPTPQVTASGVELAGLEDSHFHLIGPAGEAPVSLPLPGLYNVYNALAAAAAAIALGLNIPQIAGSLSEVSPAFGRMEIVSVQGKDVVLALAKNPVGMNEVLRTVASTDRTLHLLAMLNDNIADGRDVSWIWDADFEVLADRVASIVFAGTRPEDLALRFKYAEIIGDGGVTWSIEHDTRRALDEALAETPKGETLFVVPTYTAMLDVREAMTAAGYLRPYWEE